MVSDDSDWERDENTLTSKSRADLVAALERKPATIELIKGETPARSIPLVGRTFLIGREEGAQIQVQSREVSRRHARISKQGDDFLIMDLNSRNGVFLNGVKVHSATLQDGDTVQVGDIIFVFHQGT